MLYKISYDGNSSYLRNITQLHTTQSKHKKVWTARIWVILLSINTIQNTKNKRMLVVDRDGGLVTLNIQREDISKQKNDFLWNKIVKWNKIIKNKK